MTDIRLADPTQTTPYPLGRRIWPRIVVVLPPDVNEGLIALAERNYRTTHQEVLRLLSEAVARETAEPGATRVSR